MILLNFYLILIEYTTFIKSFYAKYSELFSKECKMANSVVNMTSYLFMT